MRHLEWLSSLYQDAILGTNPCAHHDSCRGCQAEGTGTCDAQHRYGGLEGEANHCLCPGNALVVTLQGENRAVKMKYKSLLLSLKIRKCNCNSEQNEMQ